MLTKLATLLLASAVPAAQTTLPVGTQLTYRGTMIAEKGDPDDTTKSFRLQCLVTSSSEGGATLGWVLTEKGRGGWPWTGHFGFWQIGDWQDGATGGPSLLYQRQQGLSVVPLRLPRLVPPEHPAKGLRWKQGRFESRIAESETRAGAACWRVEVTSPYRRNRTIWVRRDSLVVVEAVETVFIGQGEQYELRLVLDSSTVLNDAALQRAETALESLVSMRQQLGAEPTRQTLSLDRAQLDVLRDQLPDVSKQVDGTFLAAVFAEAAQDTKAQKNRSGAVRALAKSSLGKPAPEFSLKTASGKVISNQQLRGRVSVLHFWTYRDTPLVEPYGQVGYLDFLHRNRKDDKVNIFGVAVDERLAEQGTRGKAIAGVRKLRSFMNLSYPVLLDDGATLKKFGDPRVADAKLPLFVVVDAQGKVVHYHAGVYQIDPRLGLRQLSDVIQKSVESGE